MSEFSESYHLRSDLRREAKELLERAGLPGYAFPALDGWVSFVADGEAFRPNRALVRANRGLLLHWMFGEDHGWGFNLYRGTKRILEYSCSWEEEVVVKGKVSHAQLEEDLGTRVPLLAGEAGLRVFFPQSLDEVFEVKPAYAFAGAVGLNYFRWLSYSYLSSDASKGHPLPPGVQVVPQRRL